MLAGGGIQGGVVHGSSDKIGGYPGDLPVSPADLTATIYHCLGIDPQLEPPDQEERPFILSQGKPLQSILI